MPRSHSPSPRAAAGPPAAAELRAAAAAKWYEVGRVSQEVASQIDAEVKIIIEGAYKKAETVIKKHRKALDSIAAKLVEVETIEREDFETLLIANGIVPKKKADIEHAPLA